MAATPKLTAMAEYSHDKTDRAFGSLPSCSSSSDLRMDSRPVDAAFSGFPNDRLSPRVTHLRLQRRARS